MKTVLLISLLCVSLASLAGAQTQSKHVLLLNPDGYSITIGAPPPPMSANYTLLLPGATSPRGSLLVVNSLSGGVDALAWLAPATDGQALVLSGGVPTWSNITSGTVTSFSFTDANGISGIVTNATTTPNLTLSLGAITPTSVNGLTLAAQTNGFTISGGTTPATLTVPSNASVSGTNTGDQTITLTSDVTGSGTGSFATTISNNAVTYAKMQKVSTTSKLLGSSQTTTDVQEISLGAGLRMTNSTLSASGLGGTVTSVDLSMPGGFSVSGNPVTTSGTLTVTTALSGVVHAGSGSFTAGPVNLSSEVVNILGAANGGTGLNTSATGAGSILYTSGTGTWTTRPAGTSGYVLTMSGGFPDWVDPGTLVSFSGWALSGNSGTTAWNGSTGNFLGTTDAQPMVIATTYTSTPQPLEFFTNNAERMRLSGAGYLGINQTNPGQMLEVKDGNVLLSNSGTASQLQMQGTGSGKTNFAAGAQGASNINYVLPTAQATANKQALINDGSGNLSWGEPAAILTFAGSRDNFEDFIFDAYAGAGSNDNQYSFTQATANGGTSDVDGALGFAGGNDYFGIHILGTGTNATGRAYLGAFNNVNRVKAGGKELIFETRVEVENLSDATNHFDFYTGLMDGAATFVGDPVDGIYFQYTDNVSGGNWSGVTRNASTSTVVNSNVAVTAGQWYVLRCVVNANASNVDFYVDDVLVGSSTTNITTNAVRYELKLEKNGGALDRHVNTDWVTMRMVR